MDIRELLEGASLLVPEALATGNDLTLDDLWEHLSQDEWDVALGLLEELGAVRPLPPGSWQALASAAEQLGFERSAAWCHWRGYETRHGVIRADLTLLPAGEGGRRTPISGAGVLRPMWDIGNRSPTGGPAQNIAGLWVESTPLLEPGGRATVRLAPLDPAQWRHLRPGQVITLHEGRPVGGTAVVLEVRRPAP
ncbi:hypothetical protein GCM10009665_62410 [Kitasatospora nipponensis]|uniref:Uncharacterized protein n=1 Tax=Kitasatospora nipponensis TaxID=258049 RepID=A0ABP4HG32_9ACTN